MMKKRILALILAICTVTASFGAYASDHDYNALKNGVLASKNEGNWGKIKKIINEDYRDIIEETDEITVNVNENNIRKLHKEMMGVQYELGDEYSTFMKNSKEYNDSYISAAKRTRPIPVVRLGGTSSNAVNYILNVGPQSDRKATPDKRLPLMGAVQEGAPAYKMGPAEIIKAFKINNPDVKLMPCISYVMSGEDANHLAHYLFDKKDESEWGAMRAADGIEDPVEVYYWELGNEIDGQSNEITNARIETYTSWAIEVVEAIKKDFPDQKFIACGRTASWMDFFRPEDDPLNRMVWQRKMFPILAPYVDGMSFHPYYDGFSSEYMMRLADACKEDMDKEVEKQQIKDKDGNLKEMVVVSTESSRFSDLNISNCDFESAVFTSHYLNECFQREWYTGSMFHNAITSNFWCAYWVNYNGIWLSPTVKLMGMYTDELGDRLAEAKIAEPENILNNKSELDNTPVEYAAKDFSVLVSPKGDNELKVFITNRKAYKQRNIKFNFKNKYKLVEETVFTAPNMAVVAYDAASEALTTVEKHEMNVDNFSEYQMKGQGVTVLTLRTDSKIPYKTQNGESGGDDITDAPETESKFTDISAAYSKNEIAALAENGIISGKSETVFAPDDILTNAETAAMLVRILGLKTDYKGSLWQDVPKGVWYEGVANALYVEKLSDSESFNANSGTTVLEMMKLLGNYLINRDGVSVGEIEQSGNGLTPQGTYCVSKGLFNKYLQNKELDTSHVLTRAEAADIMYRFYQTAK